MDFSKLLTRKAPWFSGMSTILYGMQEALLFEITGGVTYMLSIDSSKKVCHTLFHDNECTHFRKHTKLFYFFKRDYKGGILGIFYTQYLQIVIQRNTEPYNFTKH